MSSAMNGSTSTNEDLELELAVELSRLSFADEERRRREGHSPDLISMDSPEAERRRAQNTEIRRLFSQPSSLNTYGTTPPPTYGWSLAANTLPLAPPVPTTPTQASCVSTPSSSAVFRFVNDYSPFPPQPDFSGGLEPRPPPLPPRLARPPSVDKKRAASQSSSLGASDHSGPSSEIPPVTPPRTKSKQTERLLGEIYTPWEKLMAGVGSAGESSMYYNQLISPRQNARNPRPVEGGDLIDLGSPDEHDLWKDFDPLYRPQPSLDCVPPPPPPHSQSQPSSVERSRSVVFNGAGTPGELFAVA